MIIAKPHLCTKVVIWAPKYSSQYGDTGEWVVLISKYKVHRASPIIIVEFTKAKHLIGKRYAVKRTYVEQCDVTDNGKIPCYSVPMSKLEEWDSPKAVLDTVNQLFPD